MAYRLPTPGSDEGNWGDILNDYLRQAHTETGQIKAGAVTAVQLNPGAITTTAVAHGSITEAKLS